MKQCDAKSTRTVTQVADHKLPKWFFFQDIAFHWTWRLTYNLLDHTYLLDHGYLLHLGRVISKHWQGILLGNMALLLTAEFKWKYKYYMSQA